MIKIDFIIKDKINDKELNLENTDLVILSSFLKQVNDFLRGDNNQDLSNMKISIKSGSTKVQVQALESDLISIIEDNKKIQDSNDLSLIDSKRAKILKDWQDSEAVKKNNRIYVIKELGSSKRRNAININISQKTNYKLSQTWVDVELYLYGHIYDMGGRDKSNIHMALENGGNMIINTEKKILADQKKNYLYKQQLLRIKAKQNIENKNIKNAVLISFENYDNNFDRNKYDKLAKKGAVIWKDVPNASDWVEEIRGNKDDKVS